MRDRDIGNVVKREVRAAGVQYEHHVPQLAAFLCRRVMAATLPFCRGLVPAIFDLEGLQIIRYRPGGFYHAHKDNFGGPRENHREVTILVYLNDDFRGGETSFPKINFAYTPRAGYVLLFPSRYRHKAEAVIEGTKYVIGMWYRTARPAGEPPGPAPEPNPL